MKSIHTNQPPVLNLFSLVAAACIVFAAALAQAAPGEVEKRSYSFKEAGKEMDYSLFVPKSYSKTKPAALVVLLHGLGANPQQVIRYAGITAEAGKRGHIVVAPFGYNERGWYGSRGKGKDGPFFGEAGDPANLGELSELDVLNVLEIVRKEFAIDENRIYLMGHSMGGSGTIYLGSKYPEIWAAIAPMAPALFGEPTATVKKLKDTPVFVVTGEKDRSVQVGDVRRWVAKMEELEIEHRYNEIEGGNHFDTITDNPTMIAELFEFFDAHTRGGAGASRPGEATAFRDFTNNSGKRIRAKVRGVSGGRASIVREDGKGFTLPIASLSDADQEFLKKWAAKNAPALPVR